MSETGISPNVTLWMFDYDGTLSPLVADRTAARLDSACRDMLHQLAAVRNFHCAVISSRLLADLEGRVGVAGIYLAGGSGLEWRLPDGRRRVPESERMNAIRKIRKTLIPEIMEWERLPGVEIEDKQWSVAVHVRRANRQTQEELAALLVRWQQSRNVPVFRGPAVLEIQFFPEVNKAFGVRAFCDLVKCPPDGARLVYAGDDENDALAMQLVRGWGGTIITVGEKATVTGADVVSSPMELAKRITLLAGFENCQIGCKHDQRSASQD
jgi:trehalose 6-phosphate phosphatase